MWLQVMDGSLKILQKTFLQEYIYYLNIILLPVGQRHIVDPGRQEPDERRRLHRQIFLRRIHKIHPPRSCSCKF